jgi:small nuclear ribonucleoprotein (snRNP)-like protein
MSGRPRRVRLKRTLACLLQAVVGEGDGSGVGCVCRAREGNKNADALERARTQPAFFHSSPGSPVVVELRDDGVVRGTLASADDALNLSLTDATWQPLQGPPHPPASYLVLRAAAVRAVHLPPGVDPRSAVDDAARAAAAARRAARTAALAAEQRQGRLVKGDGGGSGGGGWEGEEEGNERSV